MNWVGGSRSRLVMKDDAKKQRDFFEKRKMQKKLKNLGLALPISPEAGSASGSMDLVTLFIVNQIATKKENKDPPKVAVLGSSRRRSSQQNKPLVLPMSPCSPSQLSIAESQPQCSGQGMSKRRQIIPQGFKWRQLSPVLESAFSDNSASDYLPPLANNLSPFSSTSSASSGHGTFPLQLNLQQRSQTQTQLPSHCSPPLWDNTGKDQFQPLSQPRGTTDNLLWSCETNSLFYQPVTTTTAQVLFESPAPHVSDVRGCARQTVSYPVHQPNDTEPVLDFTLNQSEPEQRFEEDIFQGFSRDDGEKEAFHLGIVKTKIYLRDETPVKSSAPQTVPDSECMSMELCSCTDTNFSHPGHNTGPTNSCGCSPSDSYRRSDSDDEEEYCPPCLQASASSYMEEACCTNNHGSQGKPGQRYSQPKPLTPLINRKGLENMACLEKVSESDGQCTENHKSTSSETRDAGTQTLNIPTTKTCDASTQCSITTHNQSKPPGLNIVCPPVDVSIQHPTTGRQTDIAAVLSTHTAPLGGGGKHTPRSEKKPMAGALNHKSSADNSDSNIFLQTTSDHVPDDLSRADGTDKANQEGSEERERHATGPVMKELSDRMRKGVVSATRVSRPSEEARALQEIADILLLVNQKNNLG